MTRAVLLLFCLLNVLAAPAEAGAQMPVPRIVQRAGPAVVSLRTFDDRGREVVLGSGFILRDGRIVTNAHVVAGAARADVFDADGVLLGTVSHAEALSSGVDLAVLPRMGRPRRTLSLARQAPSVGEEVVAIGAPEGLTGTVTSGIVSAYRDMDGQRVMQITAPLSEGSSGGPVLNRRGEVVGVSVAVHESGQNLNFAVPLADLQAVVASPPGHVAFSGRAPHARRAAEEDGDGTPSAGEPRATTLRVGGPLVHGALEEGDARFGGGGYFDLYTFRGQRGQRLAITLRSDEFDAYLRLARVGGTNDLEWLGEDDDGGEGTDARLDVTVPEDGDYWIAVSAYDDAPGSYALALGPAGTAADDGAPAGMGDRWVPAGQAAGFERFLDGTRIERQGPGVVRVWVRSVYDRPHTDEFGDTYDNVMSRVDYDCAGRRWRAVQTIQYLGGTVVWSSDEKPDEWAAWVPDSVGETTGETACGMAGGG